VNAALFFPWNRLRGLMKQLLKMPGRNPLCTALCAAALFFFTIHGFAAAETAEKPAVSRSGVMGKITGTVTDSKGKPVANALIEAREAAAGGGEENARQTFNTDKNGGYSIDLPPGTYRLKITAPMLETQTVDSLAVVPDKVKTHNVSMANPATVQIEEMKVVGKAKQASAIVALARQKASKNIMDVLAAETIVKLPESDVAGILTRMPGVVVEQGKYMQVRGMPKRYNQTTLNSSILPSTRPNELEVPLDLFPAGIVEYINVVKTFSPELPGDFAGGLCQIQTRAIPDKFTMKLSSTAIYNTETSFKDYLTYRGGAKDWMGYDDGTRDLPGSIPRNKNVRRRGSFSKEGFMPNELERFGEAFPNIYDTYTKTTPLGGDYNFYVGDRFNKVGAILFLQYKNEFANRADEQQNVYATGSGGKLSAQNSYRFNRSFQYIKESAMLNTGFDISPDHKFYINQFYDRNATDEARIYTGYNGDKATDIQGTRLRWLEEQIYTGQLAGNHTIESLLQSKIKWHYNYSLATLYDPDMRDYLYLYDSPKKEFNFAPDTENPLRMWTNQDERMHDTSLDWNLTLPGSPSWLVPKFQAGGAYNYRKRDFQSRRFAYDKRDTTKLDLTAPVEELFVPPNINPYEIELTETTRPTDSYNASASIAAGYALVDLTFFKKFQFTSGGRFERNSINVLTFNLFKPSETITTLLKEDKWLPSYGLKYSPIESAQNTVNIRLNYSRTVDRPEFHELSPFEFTEVIGGYAIKGNPDLQVANIKNYDFRAEWFFDKTDLLAFSAFYKDIENAIEPTVQLTTQLRLSYVNATDAYLRGIEFEFRKNLGFINPALQYFSLWGSYLYSESETTVEAKTGFVPTSLSRPLVGQPENLVNLALEFNNPNWGLDTRFSYRFTDDRVYAVGGLGLPDIIQDKTDRFDLVVVKKLTKHIDLRFVAQNISDEPVKYTQGGQIWWAYREGRTFKLGLSYKW